MLSVACAAASAATDVATDAGTDAGTDAPPALLAVRINGQQVSEGTEVLRTAQGWMFRRADLAAWHVHPARGGAVREFDAQAYASLPAEGVAGVRLDPARQLLDLTLDPQAFDAQSFAVGTANDALTPASRGAFVNYDLSLLGGAGGRAAGAVLEVGGFGVGPGVGTTGMLVQQQDGRTRSVRLNSVWSVDFPRRMTTLRVGDVVSVPGTWGSPARLGGVQYGTDVATRPGFVTTPLGQVSGQAALPSTVDIYVDRVLALRRQVNPGPFSIGDLPLISGSGTITTVTTDLLGRQQVSEAAFYSAPALLRPGLSTFSVEAGALRSGFGTASADYGPPAMVGTWRRGIDDTFTAEGHAEWMPGRTALGVAGAWAVAGRGVASAALAASRGGGAVGGALLDLGLQAIAGNASYTVDAEGTTAGFTRFGAEPGSPTLRSRVAAGVSWGLGPFGSIALAGIAGDNAGQPPTRMVQFGYGVGLGRWGFLSAVLLRTLASPSGGATQLGLTLTVPLGHDASTTWSAQAPGGVQADLQQDPPTDAGWGYRLETGPGGHGTAQAEYRGPAGAYAATWDQTAGDGAWRLDAQGGAGVVSGHGFLSRRVDDSFALVELPGLAGVAIDANGEPVGRTSRDGTLIVPGLPAFQASRLSVAQADLPLDTDVSALSATVRPPFRSGVVVVMPVRRVRSATLTLVRDDGSDVPVGAHARLEGQRREFPVGVDGAAYLSGLAGMGAHDRVWVSWSGGRCTVDLAMPATRDPLPDLGRRQCRSVP